MPSAEAAAATITVHKAIIAATPLSFVGNKLWSFAR